jgi:hypothetical protein
MIYRGPGFSTSPYLAPPPPPLSSASSTGGTQKVLQRETACLRERVEGVGEEPNNTTARKPVHL